MSDRRWRGAERAGALGDPEAQARALRERVRAGALAADRVELAAHLGHPAAILAVDEERRRLSPGLDALRHSPFDAWAEALGEWGKDTCVRAALAAARLGTRVSSTIREAAAWAIAESRADPRQALLSGRAWSMDELLLTQEPQPPPRSRATWAPDPLGRLLDLPMDDPGCGWLLARFLGAEVRPGPAEEAIVAAVRDEVAPWALGEGDPLSAR